MLSHDIRWAGLIGGGFPAPRWPWGIKMLPPVSGSSAAPAAGRGAGAAGTRGHLSLPQPNRAMAMGKPTDRAPQFRSRTGVGGVTDLKKRGLSKVSWSWPALSLSLSGNRTLTTSHSTWGLQTNAEGKGCYLGEQAPQTGRWGSPNNSNHQPDLVFLPLLLSIVFFQVKVSQKRS